RQHYEALFKQISQFPLEEIKSRHELAQLSFLREGITFTVYNDEQGTERTMPFDFVPKVVPNDEWLMIEKGLIQRVKALNMFLDDVYSGQQILNDGVVPRELIVNSPYFYPQVANVKFPHQNHIFLAGIDLIRNEHGEYRVLED